MCQLSGGVVGVASWSCNIIARWKHRVTRQLSYGVTVARVTFNENGLANLVGTPPSDTWLVMIYIPRLLREFRDYKLAESCNDTPSCDVAGRSGEVGDIRV